MAGQKSRFPRQNSLFFLFFGLGPGKAGFLVKRFAARAGNNPLPACRLIPAPVQNLSADIEIDNFLDPEPMLGAVDLPQDRFVMKILVF